MNLTRLQQELIDESYSKIDEEEHEELEEAEDYSQWDQEKK